MQPRSGTPSRAPWLQTESNISLPTVGGQALNATVTAQSRLRTPEQFRDILLRTTPDGSVVHLSDVARVELGSENYSFQTSYNGKQASALAIGGLR